MLALITLFGEQFFNKSTKTVTDIYVIIYVTLLLSGYITWELNNRQHSMLASYDNNNLYGHKYYWETFSTFMAVLWLFFIRSLPPVNLRVMVNIQCYLFHKYKNNLQCNKCQENIPNKYVNIFVNLKQLCQVCIYGSYSKQKI